MLRILSPDRCRRMPWKNGGGVTIEIATGPEGAGLDDFIWRASVAEVVRDGPFSVFPGVDRTLVMLDGAGMRLTGPATAPIDVTAHVPIAFAGEAALDCSLVAGPVRDFNLMVRRAVAQGDVEIVRGEARTLPPAHACIVHAATGACEVRVAGEPAQSLAAGDSLSVTASGTPVSGGLRIVPCSESAVAVVAMVRIR